MKDIFTWGDGRRSKRNFTIYDLLNLKGKKKLTQVIDEINNSKSKISNSVKKNLESKPTLVNLVKTTTTKLEKTAKKYQSSKSLETSAKTKLSKVTSDLSKLLKKRAKAKARAEARAKARKAKARAEARY